MAATPRVPSVLEFIEPTFAVLRDAGAPIDNATINARVFAALSLSPDALQARHDDRLTEAEYRAHWARSYLSLAGLATSPTRATWVVAAAAPQTVDGRDVVRTVRAAARAGAERRSAIEKAANTPEATPELVEELRRRHDELLAKGVVRTEEALTGYLDHFRDRFGLQVLAGLDGEPLLETLHGRGTKDSLVYWLEFKDDDEFPDLFGGIGGGSALKFGIYKAKETGQWMTGSSYSMQVLSPSEAIDVARRQRDAILAAGRVLEEAQRDPRLVDYEALQAGLESVSGGLCNTAWIHKYLALCFPTVLDDFHALSYQRFHLLKLGKAPKGGLYANARCFAAIARQIGVAIPCLTTTLVARNGDTPHAYWRVGTTEGEKGASQWPRMRDGGFVAIGWGAIPSLKEYDGSKTKKAELTSLMQKQYPSTPQAVGKAVNELGMFVTTMAKNDIVLAMQGGSRVLGVGRVIGDYFCVENDGPFPHRRPVEWLDIEPWQLFDAEGMRTTVYRFDKTKMKYPLNVIAIEQHALLPLPELPTAGGSRADSGDGEQSQPVPAQVLPALGGTLGRIERAVERKGQVILYGPPGTGKTYWAMRAARALVARSWLGVDWEMATDAQRADLDQAGAIETCCFHPSFGYEDFLEGLRPRNVDGQLVFEPRDGVFKTVCKRADAQPSKRFVLFIDEINRGDTPRIFGELLLALEKDKRETPVRLPLTGDVLRVPKNLCIIGTMNTADRSIALLDAALRRRFGFVELMPDIDVLAAARAGDLPLGPWLQQLNVRVQQHMKRDARNLQIGHAYLLHDGQPVTDPARFAEVLRDDVIPLLEEYYYEDFEALAEVLGPAIVRRDERRIDESLFRPGAAPALLDALRKSYPEIYTTLAAAGADEALSDDDDADDDPAGTSGSEDDGLNDA